MTKVYIVLGPGGVGKTTSSVALALNLANRGEKVALLSIDPAKRLASALGMSVSSQLAEVKVESRGQVFAAMIDQKSVFDELVSKMTKSESTKEKIFSNQIYQAISENLGGAVEFMAISQLANILKAEKFDRIVLDTPPDDHALDFLNKPNILGQFIDSKLMNMLIRPFYLAKKVGLSKVVRFGTSGMRGLSEVLGVASLEKLAEFLFLMKDVIDGLNCSAEYLKGVFESDSTKFLLVTRPQYSQALVSKALIRELSLIGYSYSYLVINRCFALNCKELDQEEMDPKLFHYLSKRYKSEENISEDIVSYSAQYQAKNSHNNVVIKINDLNQNIDNYQGILYLSKSFDNVN